MRTTVWSVLIVAAFSTVALAQDNGGGAPQVPAPAQTAAMPAEIPKSYTVTLGVDFPTAYLFRGIHQESTGMIAQPPIDLGVALGKGVSFNVGQWYSMHSGPTGNFYEADYYGSLTFSTGKFKPGVLFTSYTSPNDRFSTVHELAAFVAVDDSGSRFPLAPKATVAFELDGQADGGSSQGTYLELAIKPAMKVIDAARPLMLAVPVRVGISLKDYYEGVNGSDTFGFFSTGLIASVPITTGKVVWDVHGGVDMSWLGTNMKALNGNDAVKPIGIFGITITY
jgi:hypothetical protein